MAQRSQMFLAAFLNFIQLQWKRRSRRAFDFGLLFFILMSVVLAGCAKKALIQGHMPLESEMVEKAKPSPEKSPLPEAQLRAGEPSGPTKRMVHYHGYAKLRATDPEAVLNDAANIVHDVGGYIAYMDKKHAVLHVPVNLFHSAFEKLLTLGQVLDKSISAEDITDAFQDVALRLQIAEATRQRLVHLLSKAKTDKERLSLLKEIQRVNEQIERLTNQRKTLAKLAGFSRITLDVLPRQLRESSRPHDDIQAFSWIYDLSPFEPVVARYGKKVRFETPKEMVSLGKGPFWSAESAQGVVFWASRHKNKPKGDDAFWIAAIQERLGKELAVDGPTAVGDYKILRLMSKTKKPYVYMVGVRTVKTKLFLVEAFFPSLEHEARHKAAVFESIKKGAK